MSERRIIGYHFQGSVYCPEHINGALPTGEGEAFDGWALLVPMEVEDNLDEIAINFDIERDADSNQFPLRIYSDDRQADTLLCRSCQYRHRPAFLVKQEP